MNRRELNLAGTEARLRERVVRMIRAASRACAGGARNQRNLYENPYIVADRRHIDAPAESIAEFLDYICAALPAGELYLFGGVLRDLAIFGRRGFSSDLDLVVEGDWTRLSIYLEKMGASKNRFGGYRLHVGRWPVDIWAARDTWAIREGLVHYRGIESLTKTTILNWDAILLNWRTGEMIFRPDYFSEIEQQLMDIVLIRNPNPVGAVVRTFRHLCSTRARRLTFAAAEYLGDAVKRHSPEAIVEAETAGYRRCVIDPRVLRFFEQLDTGSISGQLDTSLIPAMRPQFEVASDSMQPLLI